MPQTKQGRIKSINAYDDSRKCPVCNGPARIPSWWEMQLVEGGVQQAEANVEYQHEELVKVLRPSKLAADAIERLIAAAVLQGEQKTRLDLVKVPEKK